jgi:hypothetical protein
VKIAMTTLIERFFAHSFRDSLSFGATRHNTKTSTSHIKQALRDVIKDCGDERGQRMQLKINQATSHADLWDLRGELHQLVACVHDERLATQRINSLLSLFNGLIPGAHLTRIRSGFRS